MTHLLSWRPLTTSEFSLQLPQSRSSSRYRPAGSRAHRARNDSRRERRHRRKMREKSRRGSGSRPGNAKGLKRKHRGKRGGKKNSEFYQRMAEQAKEHVDANERVGSNEDDGGGGDDEHVGDHEHVGDDDRGGVLVYYEDEDGKSFDTRRPDRRGVSCCLLCAVAETN